MLDLTGSTDVYGPLQREDYVTLLKLYCQNRDLGFT